MTALTTRTLDGFGIKEKCPVLENPEPDCYCTNLTSLNIPMAIQYCVRDFKQCPIYRRYMGLPEYGAQLSAPAAPPTAGIGVRP